MIQNELMTSDFRHPYSRHLNTKKVLILSWRCGCRRKKPVLGCLTHCQEKKEPWVSTSPDVSLEKAKKDHFFFEISFPVDHL
jgi:hypothetical protein